MYRFPRALPPAPPSPWPSRLAELYPTQLQSQSSDRFDLRYRAATVRELPWACWPTKGDEDAELQPRASARGQAGAGGRVESIIWTASSTESVFFFLVPATPGHGASTVRTYSTP